MSFNLGMRVIRRMVEEQSPLAWHRAKLSEALFKGNEVEVFKWVNKHVQQFHVLPNIITLAKAFPEIQEVTVVEPSSYYLQKLENAYYYRVINDANIESQQVLKNNQDAHSQATEILNTALRLILQQQYRTKIMDVGLEAPGMVLNEYHSALSTEDISTFGWDYLDKSGPVMPGDVVSFVGRPAQGKAQPLDSLVLGKEGFIRMGDVTVGTPLASVNGRSSFITGVFPQGQKPVYRLTFQDGRSVEASDEHLWEIKYRDWKAPRVETTLQLIARLRKKRYQRRLQVRLFSGDWGYDCKYVLDPYLLGVLLGDGCFVSKDPRFSTADAEIVQAVRDAVVPTGGVVTHIKNYDYTISYPSYTRNLLRVALSSLGLWGKTSDTKFVPGDYLKGNKYDRLSLLQGLIDTDGTVEKCGAVTYTSTSRALAEVVQFLVRSVGGVSTLYQRKTAGKPAWVVSCQLKDRTLLTRLTRKRSRVKPTTRNMEGLVLHSIEYVGDKECQCISVSHPDNLYVTDNFVVTHNTWKMLYTAIHNWQKKRNVLFVSMEMSPLAIAQRIVTMYAHTNISQLKTGGYSTTKAPGQAVSTYDKFKKGVTQMVMEDSKLYVVDGNLAACAEDVYTLAEQLKCKTVMVDGAYLMRHKNTKLDRFTRAAENAELIKRYTTDCALASFASWQFSREASKKKGKKDQEVGLEDIGYTDVIGQISSIVLGLFQDDGVETMKKRQVRVLKGRNGETGWFEIEWDFINMIFDQIVTDAKKPPAPLKWV